MKLHKRFYVLVAFALVLTAFAQVSLVSAQTPELEAAVTEEAAAPAKPDIEGVITELNAEAATDPDLDALAQELAEEFGTQFGAEYTEAQVFVLPAETTSEDVVALYDATFAEVGWEAHESVAEVTEEYAVVAWSAGSNIFLIYFEPAGEESEVAVLVTVGMLAVPDFEGAEVVDSESNPELAALAEQMAAGIAEQTGAETEVKVMTFPADVAVEDILAFYQEEMDQAGWQPNEELTQTSEQFSSMGWLEGNEMLLIFVFPASEQTDDTNVLFWIAADLSAATAEGAEAAATPESE